MQSSERYAVANALDSKQRSQEMQSDHEHREKIYEQIDEKIAYIVLLKRFVREHVQLDSHAMRAALSEQVAPFIELLSQEERNLFDEYVRIRGSLRAIAESSLLGQRDGDKEAYDDICRACDEILMKSASNKELQFAMVVGAFIEAIEGRFDETAQLQGMYKSDRDAFFERIATLTHSDNVGDLCEEVRFNGFAVNVILSDENFHTAKICGRVRADSVNGVHMGRTSINYICQKDDPAIELESIRHEENHILSESFARTISSQEQFHRLYNFLLVGDGDTSFGDSSRRELPKIHSDIERVLRKRARYPSHNIGELIADIDSMFDGNITTFLVALYDYFNDINDVLDCVQDEKAYAIGVEIFQDMKENAFAFLDTLSRIAFVAQKLGKQEEMKAAIILFDPSDVRHVERYAKHLYTAARYQFWATLQPVICDGSYFASVRGGQKYEFANHPSDKESFFDDARLKSFERVCTEYRDAVTEQDYAVMEAQSFNAHNILHRNSDTTQTYEGFCALRSAIISVAQKMQWRALGDTVTDLTQVYCRELILQKDGQWEILQSAIATWNDEDREIFRKQLTDRTTLTMLLFRFRLQGDFFKSAYWQHVKNLPMNDAAAHSTIQFFNVINRAYAEEYAMQKDQKSVDM